MVLPHLHVPLRIQLIISPSNILVLSHLIHSNPSLPLSAIHHIESKFWLWLLPNVHIQKFCLQSSSEHLLVCPDSQLLLLWQASCLSTQSEHCWLQLPAIGQTFGMTQSLNPKRNRCLPHRWKEPIRCFTVILVVDTKQQGATTCHCPGMVLPPCLALWRKPKMEWVTPPWITPEVSG